MTLRIAKPNSDRIVDKDGRPTAKFFYWLSLVSDLEPIRGNGSPEGVIEAVSGRMYIDSQAAAGAVLYVKQSDAIAGDRTTGWVLT